MPSSIPIEDNNIILRHLKTTEVGVCSFAIGNVEHLRIRSARLGSRIKGCNPGKLIPCSQDIDHLIQDRIENRSGNLLVAVLLDIRIDSGLQCVIVAHILSFMLDIQY